MYDPRPVKIPNFVKVLLVVIPLTITAGFASCGMVTNVDANEIVVIQSPLSGDLSFHTTPGMKYRGFGKVTEYVKRSQFWFSEKHDQGKESDEAITVRFNDGGHAKISGSISWELPLDSASLTRLHQAYGSHKAIEQQLVRTVIEKSVYMTGPLMSSKESFADRRNDLLQYIEDQVQNGIYKTESIQVTQSDQMTGEKRTVNVVKLVMDGAKVIRTDPSPLALYGIKTFNPSINNIIYDAAVEQQIQAQQSATMQVQTAIAEAKKAEQAAITATKNGEARAATAKWEQEVIKAKEVTQAQQLLEVARLDAQKNLEFAKIIAQKDFEVAQKNAQQKLEVAKLEAKSAEQYKLSETLRGQGEAARRKAVMTADGALEQKIGAWVKVNEAYAAAIGAYQGNWVPSVQMSTGTPATGHQNGANALVDLLTAKTSMDMGLSFANLKVPQRTIQNANQQK
jgi:regulator of protease activity HflC (stomatin/prohibitin superfamily)